MSGVIKNLYKHDFQTPRKTALYMASLIPAAAKKILEPTPGRGNLVKAVRDYGYQVIAPEDYFLLADREFDCIVMNPPFSGNTANLKNAPGSMPAKGMGVGYWFLKDCMKKADRVIALMPWFVLIDSDKRIDQIRKYGLRGITALPRSTFPDTRMQCMVLDLEKGYKLQSYFRYFNEKMEILVQGSLFENVDNFDYDKAYLKPHPGLNK